MIDKRVLNLLTEHTTDPITLSSSGGTTVFTGPVIHNPHAESGMIYYAVSGFWASSDPGSVTTGFTPMLYYSPAGRGWFLHTTLPALSSAGGINSFSKYIPYLGDEIRLGYTVGASSIARVRCYIELNDEV